MKFSEIQHLTHLIGTTILIALYALRLGVLIRRRLVRDRSPDPKGDIAKGILDAFLTILLPWKMESTRKHWMRYVEFVLFHIGVFSNILVSFAITYVPQMIITPVRAVFVILISFGLLAGTIRFIRRFVLPDMRVISSFDDYTSMFFVLLFQVAGILALLELDWAMTAYFFIAAFFLVYEPFSKIRHYIYYPFARYFYGGEFSRKGVLKASRQVTNG